MPYFTLNKGKETVTMSKIYTEAELQHFLDLYADDLTRIDAIATATEFLNDFVKEEADIEESAYKESDIFDKIIKTFCGTPLPDGGIKLNELGAQALARYESIINRAATIANKSDPNDIYQFTSDQNQIMFNLVTLSVYRDMKLVDPSVDANKMTPGQVADLIDSVNLTDDQRKEYSNRFIDLILKTPDLFEKTPPKILTDAYIFVREQLMANRTDKDLENRFKILAQRIDFLITGFAQKINYFYSDPSNIADVWEGYNKMCTVRRADLRITKHDNDAEKKYKADVDKAAQETVERLREIVAMYEYMWNLKDLKPEDAEKLQKRWQELSDALRGVELTDDILATLAQYKFLDEKGDPLPQFLDKDGKPQLEFKPGYKLNPDGRLYRVISLAKTDVTMQNVGDLATAVKDMNLSEALSDRVPWKVAEISLVDRAVQGIEANPHRMLEQDEVDALWQEIEKDGGSITDAGYQAALDAQVNQAGGFAGLMAQHVGRDKPVVMRPFESVQDIDKLAKTRTEKIGAGERRQKIGFFKRMLKNFGAAAVFSAGLTFIGKATGIAWAGAAVGTTLGIGNMVYQGFKWRREQKKLGKPKEQYGLKAYFSDKRNWGPAIASGLGVAAVISMATGNPELAAGFGIGAMAVGGGSGAAMTYKDALAAGYTRGQALAGALGVMGATVAGGFAGRAAMNGLVNYVNTNTDSTLFRTEHQIVTTHETTQNQYPDGWIEGNEHTLSQWESPQMLEAHINGLMDAGLSHDDAVRYLLAWHDVTDHNLGGGYFDSIGMNYSDVAALRGSINGTMINLTPESMSAFNHFNDYISGTNTVRYPAGLFQPYHTPISHVLPPNATWDANGMLVPGNDVYSTWVNWGGDGVQHIPVITTDVSSVFTPNELMFPAGIGTLGIYEPRVIPADYLLRMRERTGTTADHIAQLANGGNGGNTGDMGNTGNTGGAGNTGTGGGTPTLPTGTGTGGGTGPNPTDTGTGGGTGSTPTDTGTGNGTDPQPKKRGFFGKLKDATYKVLQTGYHGLQRIQKGVNKMKTDHINNQTERELARLEGERQKSKTLAELTRERLEAYKDMDIESIHESTLRESAALAALNESLKKRLGERSLKLYAALKEAETRQDAKAAATMAASILDYQILKAKLDAIKDMGDEATVKALLKLKRDIEKYEQQSEIDLDVARQKGQNKVQSIKDDGRIDHARHGGWLKNLAQRIKGIADKTQAEVEEREIETHLAEQRMERVKTESAIDILKAATEQIEKLMAIHEFTDQQKQELAALILQEAKDKIKGQGK
jgi:hypothetical protein